MTLNNLGRKFLVEECQKVSISKFTEEHRRKTKELLISAEIEMAGVQLELTTSRTGFGGIRHWFKCPSCFRRVGTVFIHPIVSKIGCRECLGLEYRSRRYKGMIESERM